MALNIYDYNIRSIAAQESSLSFIKEFLESYGKTVLIVKRKEAILLQTPVNGVLNYTTYTNTVGMSYPVIDGHGYLYVNPVSFEGESICQEVNDFILNELPGLYTRNIRENKLQDILN